MSLPLNGTRLWMAVFSLLMIGCQKEKAAWDRLTVPSSSYSSPEAAYDKLVSHREGLVGVSLLTCLTPEARGDLMTQMFIDLSFAAPKSSAAKEILQKHELSPFSGSLGSPHKDLNVARIEWRRRLPHVKDPDAFMEAVLPWYQELGRLFFAEGLESLSVTENDAVANVKGNAFKSLSKNQTQIRFKKIGDSWYIDTTPLWFPYGK